LGAAQFKKVWRESITSGAAPPLRIFKRSLIIESVA